MVKNRTDLELLILVLNNLERCFSSYESYGICHVVIDLNVESLITNSEESRLNYLLRRYLPKRGISKLLEHYNWDPGLVKPRKRFLSRLIIKLKRINRVR